MIKKQVSKSKPEYFEVYPGEGCGRVQGRFVGSTALEACLMGPRGVGKTEGGIRRVGEHAILQPVECRPIPWAIIRDTWTNLERTVVKSILMPHPESFAAKIRPWIQYKDGGRYITLPGIWEAYCFGIDDLGDLNNLQSLQLGGLWLEEPAPAAVEDIGGGLDERIVTVGITSLRHPCEWRTVQLTMNYPDEDHWTWRRYFLEKSPSRELFRIPPEENDGHLPADYRTNMEEALKGDAGLLARLVLGQPGFVVQGEKVTPEYDPDVHKAQIDFKPYPRMMGYRFWDGGHNPTCIMGQVTPRGVLQIFPDSFVGQNIGVAQLIDQWVRPICKEKYGMIPEWMDIGDPSMETPDQSSYSVSPAMTIQDMLKTTFTPGPVYWETRKEAVKYSLLHKVDGMPFVQISASEKYLSRALRGGWHYKKLPSGLILREKAVKDIYSHPGDAFSYGVCVVLGNLKVGLYDVDRRPVQRLSNWAKSKLKSRFAAC